MECPALLALRDGTQNIERWPRTEFVAALRRIHRSGRARIMQAESAGFSCGEVHPSRDGLSLQVANRCQGDGLVERKQFVLL